MEYLSKEQIDEQLNSFHVYYSYIDKLFELPIESVLEMGCGHGYVMEYIHRKKPTWHIEGFDLQNHKNIEGFKVIEHDATKSWPYENKSFDAVISVATSILIQPEHSNFVVEEMKRVARKYLYFMEMHDDHKPGIGIREEYTMRDYKKLLQEHGLKNIIVEKNKDGPGSWHFQGHVIIGEI